MSPRPRLKRRSESAQTHRAHGAFEPDNYYTARDLAARYAVHEVTIWKWAARGILPKPEKIGPNTTRWRGAKIIAHERARSDR